MNTTPEPLDQAIPAETIYEHAGGDAGLRAIVSSFYDSIVKDLFARRSDRSGRAIRRPVGVHDVNALC